MESNKRRRDLYTSLGTNMNYIYLFFLDSVEHYYARILNPVAESDTTESCQVLQVVNFLLF